MKNEKQISNAKLGALVLAGLMFLVFSLYMIGKNQNIWGTAMGVYVELYDVNGLLTGNNVRYKGMTVGTVSDIEFLDEQVIRIRLLINKSMAPYIPNNSKTTINTDGLIGNKIIEIHPQDELAPPIQEGDVLYPLDQVSSEDMLKQLNSSGDYLETTLMNLAEISEKLNQNENLWEMISDTTLVQELKGTIRSFTQAGNQATQMAQAGKELLENLQSGDGLAASLISDSVMTQNFERTLSQMEETTLEAKELMKNLNQILEEVQRGEGTAGLILEDSLFRATLMQTLINLENSSENFNINMEALRSNFLFRKYFKKLEKEQKKAEKENKN
ncbi:MCE family protein [Algoriphagus kandeliae]|uniref:MCE family protein n=1 Tax=Algoriphagus kandeliae TaxID=2562278 RepID=A0A4Y9QYZ9_9BACT|nr:MlaD family protein [Algoriphagus kandeliae]TFV97280.1 MCE family protein [Algoriphagus kandeliae]